MLLQMSSCFFAPAGDEQRGGDGGRVCASGFVKDHRHLNNTSFSWKTLLKQRHPCPELGGRLWAQVMDTTLVLAWLSCDLTVEAIDYGNIINRYKNI